ncbi:MAG: SPOR domain-containing protein [Bacteroidia bacterium]
MDKKINISHFISELLFRHDCVIVPGFGGFACTYASARIHPGQHTFYPPSKQIVFNKHLQQNDGLLANAIATGTGCTFEEAMRQISEFTAQIRNMLNEGKRIELAHIGSLFADPEKNICFESDPDVNFLMDSFGLASFQSMPIIRETYTEKKKAIDRVDRTIETPRTAPEVKRTSLAKRIVAAALILPVVAIAAWVGYNMNTTGEGFAGMGLFHKTVPNYKPVQWVNQKNFAAKQDQKTSIQADANGIAYITLEDNSTALVVNFNKVAAESTNVAQQNTPLTSSVVAQHQNDRFFIIGGCFAVAENAEKFRNELLNKGYKPEVLSNIKSNLTHISIAGFSSKVEAEAMLQQIRKDLPEAWLLKR